jgi:methionyl-tRNA synthetase
LQEASSKQQSIIDKKENNNNKMEEIKTEESSKASPPAGGGELVPMNRDLEGALKSTIQYEDFAKLDLKVGTILSAEKIEKADKLLKLEVDLGFEKRIVVSGIALHFKPEEIVGKQVVVVANLASRKMRGIESNGMILMAEDKEGKLYFVSPDQKINEGSIVN